MGTSAVAPPPGFELEQDEVKPPAGFSLEGEQPKPPAGFQMEDTTTMANKELSEQGLSVQPPPSGFVTPKEVSRLGVDVPAGQQKNVEDALKDVYSGYAEAPVVASGAKGYPRMAGAVKEYTGTFTHPERYATGIDEARAREHAGGEFITGATEAMTPVMGVGAIAAPVRTVVGIGTGMAASYGAEKVAEAAGGSPETQELAKDVGFFLPSALGAVSGLKTRPVPPNEAGVTGTMGEAFGGRVKGAVINTPQGRAAGVKIGDTAVSVGRPDPVQDAASALAQKQLTDTAAARVANGQPPVPPQPQAPPPGPSALTSKHVEALASVVRSLPEEQQPHALLEMSGTLAQWILARGKVVDPVSGKIVIARSPEEAEKAATDIINSAIANHDKAVADAEKAKAEAGKNGVPKSRQAKTEGTAQVSQPAAQGAGAAQNEADLRTRLKDAEHRAQELQWEYQRREEIAGKTATSQEDYNAKVEALRPLKEQQESALNEIDAAHKALADVIGKPQMSINEFLRDVYPELVRQYERSQQKLEMARKLNMPDVAQEALEEQRKLGGEPSSIPQVEFNTAHRVAAEKGMTVREYLDAKLGRTVSAGEEAAQEQARAAAKSKASTKRADAESTSIGRQSSTTALTGPASSQPAASEASPALSHEANESVAKRIAERAGGENAPKILAKVAGAEGQGPQSKLTEGEPLIPSKEAADGKISTQLKDEGLSATPPVKAPTSAVAQIGEKEPESGRTIVQPSDSPIEAQALATEAAPELAQRLESTVKGLDGVEFARLRPQKKPERVAEKMQDEQEPVSTIGDLLAGQIVVDSPEAKEQVIAALNKQFEMAEPIDDYFDKGRDQKGGYRAASLQVKNSNGSTAEIQVVPREVFDIIERTHAHYAAARDAELAGDKETAKRETAIATAMNDEAWEKFQSRNGVADTSAKTPNTERSPEHRVAPSSSASGESAASSEPTSKTQAIPPIQLTKGSRVTFSKNGKEQSGTVKYADSQMGIVRVQPEGSRGTITLRTKEVKPSRVTGNLPISETAKAAFWDAVKGKPEGHYKGAERRAPESIAARGVEATDALARKHGLEPTAAENQADVAAQRDQIRELTAFVDPETAQAVISAHPEVKELLAPPERLSGEQLDWRDAANIIDRQVNTMPAGEALAALDRAVPVIRDAETPDLSPQERAALLHKAEAHRVALRKDAELKQIAAAKGRQFFDVNGWLAPDFGDSGFGHVMAGNVLAKVALGDGYLDPAYNVDNQGIFVNVGPGQAARIRLQHQAGMAPLVFDKAALQNAGIEVRKGAEGVIEQRVPLRYLTREAKLRAVDVILNELDHRKKPITDSVIGRIAHNLGLDESIVRARVEPRTEKSLAATAKPASNKEAHETGRVSEEVQPTQRRQEERVPESGATPGRTGTNGEGSPASPGVGERPESSAIPAPGSIGEVETHRLSLAPHRFQYKLNTDAEGVGTLLKETKEFKPELAGVVSIWRDPADGRIYAINGHHRVELAKRTSAQKLNVFHIKADTEKRARAIGALQNIAEGRGTAIDAAKFMRESEISADELKAEGISLGEATAAKGLALSKLDDSIFNKVVQGEFPMERAVAIGEATDNHAEQKAVVELIERKEQQGKKITNDTLRELVRFVKGAGKSEEQTLGLFGTESVAKSHALEKAEVSAYIKQQLAKDKKLFGFVSKGERAEELERGNNIIDVKTSKALAEAATQGEEVYNKLSERAGPISDILDDAAARIAGGENANAVKQEAYADIKTELAKTLGRGQAAGVREREEAARSFSLTEKEPVAEYRNRQPSNGELGDSELSSWSKSRTLRISDGGKQSTLFGNDEPMYKLTRLNSEGEQEHTLISQAQFDQARKQFPNFDKAARGFEQGIEPVGPQTSLFETKAEKPPQERDTESGDLFRQDFNEALFRSHSGIPFDAIPAAAKYVATTIKNSDPAQNLKELIADEAAKVKQSRELQKGLYDLEGAYAADVLRAVRLFKSMPGNAIDQEVIYHSLENPKIKLNAEQELIRNVILKPLMSQSERIYKKLSDGGIPVENYVHRVVQGKGNFIDRLLEGSKGGPGNILSKRAGATKSRSMMALEDERGNRKLVSLKGETVQLVQRGVNGEQLYKPAGIVETKDGERVVSLSGKLWKLKQATTKEIEAGTDLRYYKNAAASTITSYLELRKAERAYDFLESLKSDPKFQDLAWTKGKDGTNAPPKGWKPTKLAQFQGYYFEPHQAEVLDWYWDRIHHDVNAWDKLGRVMMTSIFYNPLLHVPNVAEAWAVEGGATRFAPTNIKNAWKAGDRARRAVMELNDDYIQALEAGAPLQAYRPEADQLQKMFFEHLGDKMQEDTGFAAQMKEMFGSNFNPYAISHKITWGSNDIMLLQSIYEHMGKGDSMKEAIRKATEIIPDYRLPTRMFDSKATASILSNRAVTMFMPYHYGVLKSAAKIAEGAAKGDKAAYDKLIALALITFVLYPLIDKGVRKASGQSNARMKRSGLAGLIDNVEQVVAGNKAPTQALQSVITPAVHTKTAAELFFNKDFYTGRPIYDQHAPAGKIAKQVGRKLASTIGPADAALRAYDNKHGARGKLLWQQAGVTFPNHKRH